MKFSETPDGLVPERVLRPVPWIFTGLHVDGRGKCSKIPQNPTRQAYTLLGCAYCKRIIGLKFHFLLTNLLSLGQGILHFRFHNYTCQALPK